MKKAHIWKRNNWNKVRWCQSSQEAKLQRWNMQTSRKLMMMLPLVAWSNIKHIFSPRPTGSSIKAWIESNPSPVSRYVSAFQTHKLKMLRYEYLIHTFVTVIKSLKPSSCPGSRHHTNSCHSLHCYADDIQLNCPTQPMALWQHRPRLSSVSVLFGSHLWNINSYQSCLLSLEENVTSISLLLEQLNIYTGLASKALNQLQPLCSPTDITSILLKLRWLPVNQHTVGNLHPGSQAEPGLHKAAPPPSSFPQPLAPSRRQRTVDTNMDPFSWL